MHRALVTILVLATAVVPTACDDPTRPDPNAQLARAALSDGPSFTSAWAVSPTEISVAWDDRSRNESGFELHRSSTGIAGAYTQLVRVGPDVTSHDDRGLTQGAEYCYKVRSFKVSGKNTSYSAFAPATCARTKNPPPAPTAVTAVPSPYGVIDVSWTQPTSTVTAYRVERSALPEGPWQAVASSISASPFRDTDRPVETQACYRIFAFNNDGDSPPSTVDCTTPPAKPTSLLATSGDAASVDLTWACPCASEDGFELHRSTGNNIWDVIATPQADATAWHDAGLVPDTRYFYRIRTRKDDGYSEFTFSAPVVVIGNPPPAPSGANASSFSSTSTYLTWQSSAVNVETFQIERSTNAQAGWDVVATVPGSQQWFSEGGRAVEQEVCYRVRAQNRLGLSTESNADCVTPVARVMNAQATPAGNGAIDLTWSLAPSTTRTGISVWYFERYVPPTYCYSYYCYGYDRWTEVATLGPGETSYQATGLSPEQMQEFIIVVIGPDARSDEVYVSSLTEPTPVAPSNVTASNTGPGSVAVQWSDNSDNEHGFSIQRCTGTQTACGDGDFVPVRWVPANSTAGEDTGVAPATTYTYRVVALAGAAASVSTNLATVTTPALPEE